MLLLLLALWLSWWLILLLYLWLLLANGLILLLLYLWLALWLLFDQWLEDEGGDWGVWLAGCLGPGCEGSLRGEGDSSTARALLWDQAISLHRTSTLALVGTAIKATES